MFPPTQGLRLDVDAISEIFGSISIACWIVVFSPQIIENWRRGSSEGLSIVFLMTWLLGDFFNIFGAVLQGVLPTMTILAVYYTLADIVLLLQCFWYRGFTLRDDYQVLKSDEQEDLISSEASPLIRGNGHSANGNGHDMNGASNDHNIQHIASNVERRLSNQSDTFRERFLSIDGTHLSPVTPLLNESPPVRREITKPPLTPSLSRTILFNTGTILLVCSAGIFGWYVSARHSPPRTSPPQRPPASDPTLQFNLLGQVFGYICAALYLGSRIPQLLLNYRRKSTEGISMLFFLFACLGNLTYVLSIVVYKPTCVDETCREGEARSIYLRYIAVNFSWLLGSFGTLALDAGVFVQFFLYLDEEDQAQVE